MGYGCHARTPVFDVNETLLDPRPLDPLFESIFRDAAAREAWFTLLLQRASIANRCAMCSKHFSDYRPTNCGAFDSSEEALKAQLKNAGADLDEVSLELLGCEGAIKA